MSTPIRVKVCPKCQQPSPVEAQWCTNCQHQFRTQFTTPDQTQRDQTQLAAPSLPVAPVPLPPTASRMPPVSAVPTFASAFCAGCAASLPPGAAFCPACARPVVSAGAITTPGTITPAYPAPGYPAPAYPTPAFSSVPQVNAMPQVNVQINQQRDHSGWFAAAIVALFATPIGWILLPMLIGAVVLVLLMGAICLPLIAGVIGAALIAASRLPNTHKAWAIPLALLLGAGINIVMWRNLNADNTNNAASSALGNNDAGSGNADGSNTDGGSGETDNSPSSNINDPGMN